VYTATSGWCTVGDHGDWDGARLSVHGRADAVTTAGATVRLSDVERALDGRVTCFGVARPSVGEVLGAAVTDAAEVPDLKRLARDRLRPEQRPRVWVVVAEVPLTPEGKVDRAALARC
jgi:acyl-coenzyme A synthetase/AMP-(fatty) acid ligase